MAFERLIGDSRNEIILVNLHEMATKAVAPKKLVSMSLAAIEANLRACRPNASRQILRSSVHGAVFSGARSYQVQGLERPRLNMKVSAILGFDKVLEILLEIRNRRDGDAALASWVDTVAAPGAPLRTIKEAADVLNLYGRRSPEVTLSSVRTIFWAAPTTDIDQEIADHVIASGHSWSPLEIAAHLRNRLGLVHIAPFSGGRSQHLFLFQSRRKLSELKKSRDITCRRPTTLDGIDNPRFSQALRGVPRLAGCGMTIDLTNGRFGPGLPEITMTPISLGLFECRYIGELVAPPPGTHKDFLLTLAPSVDLKEIAGELSSLARATAP